MFAAIFVYMQKSLEEPQTTTDRCEANDTAAFNSKVIIISNVSVHSLRFEIIQSNKNSSIREIRYGFSLLRISERRRHKQICRDNKRQAGEIYNSSSF